MDISRDRALRFVVLLGAVSLFADITYEGARSIAGPFLAVLGASGAVVGIVAGLGELTGYGLRLVSGWIGDRSRRYWALTVIGYTINLGAVPLLALAGRWELAAGFLVAERVGKAVRTPARDAMLSYAAGRLGAGRAFGLHEALDQVGAVAGPVIVAAVLHWHGSFRAAFVILLIPAGLAMTVLLVARALYPRPRDLEPTAPVLRSAGLPGPYWLYLAAAGLMAAGYLDFAIIAYHFERTAVVSRQWIPLFYAAAMGTDAGAALLLGHLYDRIGMSALVVVSLTSSSLAPLTLLGDLGLALLGMLLWGAGMGAQESVMRAAVAEIVPPERRGSAYGWFNAGYGAAWFLGSAALGALYDVSLTALIALSVAAELVSGLLFLTACKRMGPRRPVV